MLWRTGPKSSVTLSEPVIKSKSFFFSEKSKRSVWKCCLLKWLLSMQNVVIMYVILQGGCITKGHQFPLSHQTVRTWLKDYWWWSYTTTENLWIPFVFRKQKNVCIVLLKKATYVELYKEVFDIYVNKKPLFPRSYCQQMEASRFQRMRYLSIPVRLVWRDVRDLKGS